MQATAMNAAAAASSVDCLGGSKRENPLKGMQGLEIERSTHRDVRICNVVRAGLVEDIIKISRGASIGKPIQMISGKLPFFPSSGKLGVLTDRMDRMSMEEPVMWDSFRQGRMIEKGLLYRQTYVIRSYEVSEDKTASIETLMNYFQETSLGHVMLSGIGGDGFGTTKAMVQTGLIWVVSRMHVEIDRYPVWGEVVEMDTWIAPSGKNAIRRDWLLRSVKSGQVLARATSTWVMMHQQTRRLTKMPDAAREEMLPHFRERRAFENGDPCLKINKLQDDSAPFKTPSLQARRTDMDMNHHVNNVKYITWMTESVPPQCLETQEIRCITLEYRRECGQTDLVDSLTSPEQSCSLMSADRQSDSSETSVADPEFPYLSGSKASLTLKRRLESEQQFIHLLKMQADGAEIVRGRTIWRPKPPSCYPLENLVAQAPAQSDRFSTGTSSLVDKSRKVFPSI